MQPPSGRNAYLFPPARPSGSLLTLPACTAAASPPLRHRLPPPAPSPPTPPSSDAVATLAEEVRHPARDLPIGIIGSLAIATVLYVLMAATITGMTSYINIDVHAPFSTVFKDAGMQWAGALVAVGALCGINTSLLGSLTGQSRIFVTLGRSRLLPDGLAAVNSRTRTPVNACVVTGVLGASLALLMDMQTLSQVTAKHAAELPASLDRFACLLHVLTDQPTE